jgi:hypothetical protein
VTNDDSLVPAVEWMTIGNNALYTAIDFISELILVSISNITNLSSINFFFFLFLNELEALPMLDHVAPTIGYGYPMSSITCVLRYCANLPPKKKLTDFQN